MEPAKHWLSRLLNLVGITSPEDAARKKAALPKWKGPEVGKKTGEKAPGKQK